MHKSTRIYLILETGKCRRQIAISGADAIPVYVWNSDVFRGKSG
ncbi:MAG: hypothetical protein ACKERG_02315 [Candidatus Hodgkinia cicadicola]